METDWKFGSVVGDVKAHKERGVITAEFSVFGNLDSDGDIVVKGAFEPAFEANPNPAHVWTHLWQIPPIGETLEIKETDTGAQGTARYFLDDHEIAGQVYAGVKSGAIKQYSYHYVVGENGAEKGYSKDHGREVRYLKSFSQVAEWGPTLVGANQATRTLDVKSPMMRMLLDPDSLSDEEFKSALELIGLKLGARNSRTDAERLQQIHDLTLENGAACPTKAEGDGGNDPSLDPDYLRRVADLRFASPS